MKKRKMIGVRVPRDLEDQLRYEAKKEGLLLGEYLRKLLVEHANRVEERQELYGSLSSIKKGVELIGEKLAVAVEGILVTTGRLTKEQASKWVEDKIRRS